MTSAAIADLMLGMAAELTRTYDGRDIEGFAAVTGDLSPAPADQTVVPPALEGPGAHSMLAATLISAVIGTKLPGPGSSYLSQSLKFLRPIRAGDTVTARVAVIEIVTERNLVTLQTTCADQRGERLLEGTALVRPPRLKPPTTGTAWVKHSPATPRWSRLAIVGGPQPQRHTLLVGQRMTPRPVTISPHATLSAARALMERHRIRHLPVLEGRALVGMLTDADLGPEVNPLADLLQVRDVMTRECTSIAPTARIGEASALLVSRDLTGLPVVEDGRLVGLLTVNDALEALVALGGG